MTSSNDPQSSSRRRRREDSLEVQAPEVVFQAETTALAQVDWDRTMGTIVPSPIGAGNDELELDRYARSYAEYYELGTELEMPAPESMAQWIATGACPPDALAESCRRLEVLFDAPCKWFWSMNPEGPGVAMGVLVQADDLPTRSVTVSMGVGDVIIRYAAPGAPRPGHPLAPIMQAWFNSRPIRAKAESRRRGILPKQVALRQGALPALDIPGPGPTPGMVPEPTQGFLPGLIPDRPPLPALLDLYDRAGGRSTTGARPAPVEMRFFTTALMALPVAARDGRLHEMVFTVREIVEDWLNWKTKNYRVRGKFTGVAFQQALNTVRDMCIQMPRTDSKPGRGGWYYPIMVSAGQGWDLDSQLALVMRLPPGAGVGPQVDRAMLSYVGNVSGPSYRAYLGLVCEWDRVGGHNGRLIRPTQPQVLRAPGGQVVDSSGRILTNPNGQPVFSPYDERAVVTGDREPNPARVRYPEYDAEGLVSLCFNARVLTMQPKEQYHYQKRARRAVELIESLEGCVIERGGNNPRNGNLPWRIMPPNRLPPDPREIGRAGLQPNSPPHSFPIPL